MKKYIKTFGDFPEEVMVLRTKLFFDEHGIAEVEDDEVAEVLDAVPGYDFVSDDQEDDKGEETPEEPSDEDEDEDEKSVIERVKVEPEPEEDTSEEDSEDETDEDAEEAEAEEEVASKPIKAPSRPRRANAKR